MCCCLNGIRNKWTCSSTILLLLYLHSTVLCTSPLHSRHNNAFSPDIFTFSSEADVFAAAAANPKVYVTDTIRTVNFLSVIILNQSITSSDHPRTLLLAHRHFIYRRLNTGIPRISPILSTMHSSEYSSADALGHHRHCVSSSSDLGWRKSKFREMPTPYSFAQNTHTIFCSIVMHVIQLLLLRGWMLSWL